MRTCNALIGRSRLPRTHVWGYAAGTDSISGNPRSRSPLALPEAAFALPCVTAAVIVGMIRALRLERP